MSDATRSKGQQVLPIIALAVSAVLVIVTVVVSAWGGSGDWTEATAAAGLVATVVSAGVLLGTAQGWANGRRLSLAAVTTAVIGLGAIGLGIVTYVGSAGDGNISGTSASVDDRDNATDAVAADPEAGSALQQQVSNNEPQAPGAAHDVGSHPTYLQFMTMDEATLLRNVPGGTLTPSEVGVLQEQLAEARAFAQAHNTIEKAQAAGYFNTTNDVPFMGAHFINAGYLYDGVFDAGKPEGLLFSKRGGGADAEWQLVGVWYLLFPGQAGSSLTIPPEGFAGNLELWHEHVGLCTRNGIISEGNSAASCQGAGDNFIGDIRWMTHVWVWPEGAENYDGVFAYLNQNLWEMQREVRAQ